MVDVVAADEAEAVAVGAALLSYFQGPRDGLVVRRPALLRAASRRTASASTTSRAVLDVLADAGSVLELRPAFGRTAMVTALVRIEGRPVGVIANDPSHLGGAIDADGADKAARFMQLCDAFGLPLLLARRHARLHGRARRREDRDRAPHARACS